MELKPPTIILFDMDGTTVRHVNPGLLNILEALDDWSHKLARLSSSLFGFKVTAPRLVTFREGKRKKLLVHRAMHKMRRKEVDEIVEPCPGIYDVLDYLKEQNIRIGLISNGLGTGYGHDVLQTFDLEEYYDVTLFREDIPRAKPHPDPILKALEVMFPDNGGPGNIGASGEVIWYFGDRQKDIIAALAAKEQSGLDIVPFAYNMHAAIAILKHNMGPDHIIMGWPDFLPKLEAVLDKKTP